MPNLQDEVDQAVNRMFGPSTPELRNSLNYDMLLIQALDPLACLRFVTTSAVIKGGMAWVVDSSLRITDGDGGPSMVEHRETPWEAVQAYRIKLQGVAYPEAIVARLYGEERRYIWNGAAWREVQA